MAPEQVGGVNAEIDHRADQFSLAALSYRLLTGHEPFSGADPFAILQKVINETQPPPSHWSPGLSAAVDAVIGRAMSKRQDARYPDVMAFADALRVAVSPIALGTRPVPRPIMAVPATERPQKTSDRCTNVESPDARAVGRGGVRLVLPGHPGGRARDLESSDRPRAASARSRSHEPRCGTVARLGPRGL